MCQHKLLEPLSPWRIGSSNSHGVLYGTVTTGLPPSPSARDHSVSFRFFADLRFPRHRRVIAAKSGYCDECFSYRGIRALSLNSWPSLNKHALVCALKDLCDRKVKIKIVEKNKPASRRKVLFTVLFTGNCSLFLHSLYGSSHYHDVESVLYRERYKDSREIFMTHITKNVDWKSRRAHYATLRPHCVAILAANARSQRVRFTNLVKQWWDRHKILLPHEHLTIHKVLRRIPCVIFLSLLFCWTY